MRCTAGWLALLARGRAPQQGAGVPSLQGRAPVAAPPVSHVCFCAAPGSLPTTPRPAPPRPPSLAGGGASLEQTLAAATAAAKQAGAAQFVQLMQQEAALKGVRSQVGLAPHLQPGHSTPAVTPAWLAAVAQLLQTPIDRCIVAAANGPTVRAAAAAGAVAVAVPRKLAYAAAYPEARAKFEGFGPGYATWGRLASLMPVRAPQ